MMDLEFPFLFSPIYHPMKNFAGPRRILSAR
jgi:hypothetical protein